MSMVKKLVKCKCGTQSNFEINTDLNIDDAFIRGNCPSCGADIEIKVTMSSLVAQKPGEEKPLEMPVGLGAVSTEQVVEKKESPLSEKESLERAVSDIFGR